MERMGAPAIDDARFSAPLYTIPEAAGYLSLPETTFRTWVRGYTNRRPAKAPTVGAPILTAIDAGDQTRIPFVGLVEGMVLAAIRASGVPLQRIRPALEALQSEWGLEHALASRRLYTDGAEVLYDLADGSEPAATKVSQLVVVRNGQHVFSDIVQSYLKRIDYSPKDGFANLIHLPEYETEAVVVDIRRAGGKPIFRSGGARVADVLERFWTGESLEQLAGEFGVPELELEDALRVASRRAA
jgi:uncharacterized protein (DUF433 family)